MRTNAVLFVFATLFVVAGTYTARAQIDGYYCDGPNDACPSNTSCQQVGGNCIDEEGTQVAYNALQNDFINGVYDCAPGQGSCSYSTRIEDCAIWYYSAPQGQQQPCQNNFIVCETESYDSTCAK
jgi:hypothetical protein